MGKVLKGMLLCVISVTFLLSSSLSYAKDRVYTTDVAIVGAGCAGLTAAVSAAQNGAKVMVLEKNAIAGGTTNYAEGLFAVETLQLRDKGMDISKEKMYKEIIEFNHHRVNAGLLRLAVEESPKTIKWLEGNGLKFESIKMSYADSPVWHVVGDYKTFHHGASLIARMLDVANELGVKILYETPGQKLIYENGVVKGVEGRDAKGNKVIIKAGAVIIATGGFPENKELVRKYTRWDPEIITPSVPLGKTGDGITMAMNVGAATEGWGLMVHNATRGPGVTPFGNIFTMTWQPNLWVNKYGDRFIDETAVFSFVATGNAVDRQPGHFCWSIFDQDAFDKYAYKDGIEAGIGVIIPIGTKLKDLKAEFEASEKAGNPNAAMADTLEELAVKMQIDPAKLKTTVANYNSYKENNYDKEFWKDPKWIMPVKKAKFYAVKVMPQCYVSIGGVKITNNMEVINEKDQAIAGLYATGSEVGGLYGDTYSVFASGSSFGFAATSGRIAGKNAAAKVLNK